MSLIKGGLLLGTLASPLAIAYVFTADHSRLSFGTPGSNAVANRFSNFDLKAHDTHLSVKEQRQRRKERHAKIHEQIRDELL